MFQDAIADYRIETALDAIIGTSNRYFSELCLLMPLTFVENKRGTATRMGKRGNWLLPNLAPLGSGTIARPSIAETGCKWTAIGWRHLFYIVQFHAGRLRCKAATRPENAT